MHILYVDMSGTLGSDADNHFVMAGVAVKETGIYHVIKELDDIVVKSALKLPKDIELHGVEILRGKKFWRSKMPQERVDFFKQCLSVFHGPSKNNLRCFGMVIEKGVDLKQDVAEHCYEQMCSRFNSYLQRLYIRSPKKERHRGLLVVDESKYEGLFQNLSAEYRVNGTKWGNLRNLAEIPLFASSEASRLIQLADLVSYALWQRFERKDDQYFKTFVSAFDYADSVYHGIYHKRLNTSVCECPGCATRALRGR
jgi:hypothetical protein